MLAPFERILRTRLLKHDGTRSQGLEFHHLLCPLFVLYQVNDLGWSEKRAVSNSPVIAHKEYAMLRIIE